MTKAKAGNLSREMVMKTIFKVTFVLSLTVLSGGVFGSQAKCFNWAYDSRSDVASVPILTGISVMTRHQFRDPANRPHLTWDYANFGTSRGLSVAMGSIDLDGKVDMAWTTAGGGFHWGKSTGLGNFDITSCAAPEQHGIAVGDLNNDGLTDVAFAGQNPNESGSVIWWQANLSGVSQGQRYVLLNVNEPQDIALYDMNGDGSLDILFSGRSDIPADGGAIYQILLNQGSFVSVTRLVSRQKTVYEIAIGDINGDGVIDLVWAEGDSIMTGSVPYGQPIVICDGLKDAFAVAIGDVDDDGDFDLVHGGYWGIDGLQSVLRLNNGSGHFGDGDHFMGNSLSLGL